MKRKTPLKRTKRINPISERRKEENIVYFPLVARLRELCGNRSELSGEYADWQTHWSVESHHITGRTGKKLYDPFNLILLTRTEHDIEEGKIPGIKVGEEVLLAIVREIRIAQGFKETSDDK